MHRRTLLARCSATGTSLRGLADPSGPSLCSGRRRSWGSQRPSQACSRDGWPVISDRPGPHACSSGRAPRFIFVGSICRRVKNMRAISWRLVARAVGLASGLDSRLRSVSPSLRRAAMPALMPEDRSCHGLCLSQGCGHGLVQPAGLDPVRIIWLQGRGDRKSRPRPSSAHGLTSGFDITCQRVGIVLSSHGLPFSVLRGQMPCPSGHFPVPGTGSLSEVSHLP